ncbi:hypothetical protein V8C86DRAFT_2688179 [Haematococcus lacustris]
MGAEEASAPLLHPQEHAYPPILAYGQPVPGYPAQPCYQPPPPYQAPSCQAAEPVVLVCHHHETQSEYMTCGHCRRVVVPQPAKAAGACTWLVAAGLFLTACWPCIFLPFCCCDWTKDDVLRCPHCRAELLRVRQGMGANMRHSRSGL